MKANVISSIIVSSMSTASSSSNNIAAPALRSLMQHSRHLEDNNDDQQVQNNTGFDLSQYSVKFEKCQTTKQYDANNNNNGNSVLLTKRFIIFRLCPDDSCSNYGEYLIDMDSYLQAAIPQLEAMQEQYCEECNACVNVDDDGCNGVDVDTCYQKCTNIANMESNGYVDAALYTQCGKVYQNQNTGVAYYAGAMCSSSGTKIKIGLFSDQTCSTLAEADNIDHYIKNDNGYNVKLSYHLLKQTFSAADGGNFVVNCYQDGGVSDMCQNLYEEAGKCESTYGFAGMSYDAESYSSQISNEQQVCEFISKIKAGHYDQTGEIVLTGLSTYSLSGANLSDSQIFALTFFVVGVVGLALYAFYLRRKVVGSQKALSDL
ncbi:hypothetical protein ACHAXN_006515 [Cyclotella atomus]